jgi:hypothetical protein
VSRLERGHDGKDSFGQMQAIDYGAAQPSMREGDGQLKSAIPLTFFKPTGCPRLALSGHGTGLGSAFAHGFEAFTQLVGHALEAGGVAGGGFGVVVDQQAWPSIRCRRPVGCRQRFR